MIDVKLDTISIEQMFFLISKELVTIDQYKEWIFQKFQNVYSTAIHEYETDNQFLSK